MTPLTTTLYFTTSTVIDWVDIFSRPTYRRITNYRFWQEGTHGEEIYTAEFLRQKVNYIHQNPVRAEIVTRTEDYLYSSARNYAGEKGLLDVEVLCF